MAEKEEKPRLVLGRPQTFDQIVAMFKKLMGREPSKEEVEAARKTYERPQEK